VILGEYDTAPAIAHPTPEALLAVPEDLTRVFP
jgi:hypothetical protein